MPDVLIHRCTLRVIRRAGWNWGPDPRRITQEAVRILPELLAKKLAELLTEAEDVEIAAPLSLRIRVRMSELVGDPALVMQAGAPPGAGASASFDEKVEFALRSALGLERDPRPSPPRPGRDSGASDKFTSEPLRNIPRNGGALSRLMLTWHEHGVLERRLAALPNEEIETWHHSLSKDSAGKVALEPETALALRIEELVLSHILPAAPQDRHEILRRHILIATAVAAQLSLPLTQSHLWIVLDRVMPVESSRPASRIATPLSSGDAPRREWPEHLGDPAVTAPPVPAHTAPSVLSTVERRPTEWSVKIDCALPFLTLGPLARLGYFAALDAVLEAANLGRDAHLFAVALAYKVLDPPQRGWLRSPASMLAAATFAGFTKPVDEEALIAFTHRIAPHTSALDLILADSLIAGHTPGEPVTLHRAGPEILTLDTEGCFPIAWARDFEPLLAILKRLGPPVALISSETVNSALLRDLDAAGITFVTDVPPVRGDRWQRIQQGAWTNYSGPVTEPIRRATLAMGPAFEEARGIAKELVEARPAAARASSLELDRSLTLAASVALGMISWKLWRSRGRTTPQQVLERHADLEGRVRFDASSVHIDLPLGRRHQELRENGFLAPVSGIPWFGDRRVEFGGG
jgi:hypothetical protein